MKPRVSGVIVATMLMVGAGLATASPASADVLIAQPVDQVCRGHAFKVGVWYQSYSGGSRRYRINVYAPGGRRVFHRAGRATTTWHHWRIRAHRLGKYRVVYRGGGARHPWKDVSRVRSHRC